MVKKIQLKNGFTVLLNRQTKSPVVSLQVWVANGSAHEMPDEAGVSHFIEHLVFKGTPSFGPGEIAKTIEGCGGQLNAYTTFDQTVYYVTLGKNEVNTGLQALSEMVFLPQFDVLEVDREREVVIEEIRRGLDEPTRVNTQFSFSQFFKEHPYGRPIIGYDEVISSIPVEKIKDYFEEQYHPENMFLLITGDFDETSLMPEVEKLFSYEGKKDFKARDVPSTRLQNKPEFKFLKTEFEETFFNFYWPAADIKSKDYLCLEIIALILGQGESSRLYKKLKLNKGSVRSVGAYPFSIKHPGLFAISTRPFAGQEEEMIKQIVDVMNEIAKEGMQAEDYEKAIINFKSDLFYSLETCDGLARQVGQVKFFYDDENYLNTYMNLLDEVSIEDLNQCFAKYLLQTPHIFVASKDETLNKGVYVDIFEKHLSKSLGEISQHFKPKLQLSWEPLGTTQTEIQKYIIGPGVRLYLKDQKDTPVVHMDLGFLGGSKLETDPKDVASAFVQRCWARTTHDWNEEKTLFELEKTASSISAFSGKHSLGLQMTTLSSYRDHWLNMLPDFLRYTQPNQEMVDRESKLMLEALRRRKDNSAQTAFINFMQMAFSGHYYSKDSIQILESTSNPSPEQISGFITKHMDPQNMVISIVGDLGDVDQTVASLEKAIENLEWTTQGAGFSPELAFPHAETKGLTSDKEQSHIIFGFRGLNYKSDKKAVLSVIQAILAGQGGRLFIELRDKESLAYTVSPIRMEGLEGGYFGSYIACAPSKKDKAITMMKEEFTKLTQDLVPEIELLNAKRSIIGKMQISLQRNSNISENIFFDSLYGLDYNHFEKFEEMINAVTATEIRELMAELYSRPHYLVSVG